MITGSFMQTGGVAFLIPLLSPFFIGSLVLAKGLKKQLLISKTSGYIFIAAFLVGLFGAVILSKILEYQLPGLTLTVLGLFAIGQSLIGLELLNFSKKMNLRFATLAQC